MKRRVLFISHRGELGGGEISLLSLIIGLNNTGLIEPYIIIGEKEKLYEKICDAGFIPSVISMPPIKKLNIFSILKILFFVIINKIDIIHCNTTRSVFYSILASIYPPAKLIWHNRGTDKRGKFEYLLSFFAKKLIAISETVQEQLIDLKIPEKKICVVYNGIETSAYSGRYEDIEKAIEQKIIFKSDYAIGLIGRFTNEKNHLFAVEAANILINKKNIKNIKFIFVGCDNFGQSVLIDIRKKIKDYNLSAYFVFPGFIDDIVGYVNNEIDIMLIPSKREAFGRVVLESWLALTPVIAFDLEGLAELIDNNRNGMLLKANDTNGCCDKIIRFINEPELRKKLITNGWLKIKQFDISNVVTGVLNIYVEV